MDVVGLLGLADGCSAEAVCRRWRGAVSYTRARRYPILRRARVRCPRTCCTALIHPIAGGVAGCGLWFDRVAAREEEPSVKHFGVTVRDPSEVTRLANFLQTLGELDPLRCRCYAVRLLPIRPRAPSSESGGRFAGLECVSSSSSCGPTSGVRVGGEVETPESPDRSAAFVPALLLLRFVAGRASDEGIRVSLVQRRGAGSAHGRMAVIEMTDPEGRALRGIAVETPSVEADGGHLLVRDNGARVYPFRVSAGTLPEIAEGKRGRRAPTPSDRMAWGIVDSAEAEDDPRHVMAARTGGEAPSPGPSLRGRTTSRDWVVLWDRVCPMMPQAMCVACSEIEDVARFCARLPPDAVLKGRVGGDGGRVLLLWDGTTVDRASQTAYGAVEAWIEARGIRSSQEW